MASDPNAPEPVDATAQVELDEEDLDDVAGGMFGIGARPVIVAPGDNP